MSNFTAKFNSITVAFNKNGAQSTGTYTNITGCALWEKLKNLRIGNKDGSHFLRTSLELDEQRKCLSRGDHHCAQEAWLIIIDVDQATASPQAVHEALKQANTAHIIIGTHSYYADNKNRFRIILLSDTAYSKEQLEPTSEAIVEMINCLLTDGFIDYAKENKVFSQAWYTPSKPQMCDRAVLYLEYTDGLLFPVKNKQMNHDVSQAAVRPSMNLAQGQISTIVAWNEQIPVGDVLQEHGYKLVFRDNHSCRWLSPNSTSGQGGVTEDQNIGKIFSYHNDCLNDTFSHDSFDVMRLLKSLSFKEAVKFASQKIKSPDGQTVDQWNKNAYKNEGLGIKNKFDPLLEISFLDYQPFNNQLLPVEEIPYKALPDQMGHFIKEQSEIRGCPPDFILVSLLARMSALFAGKIKIALTRNTSWQATPNFYWGMIGDPSTGKSNALNATSKSVLFFEAEAREKHKHEFREYKVALDSLTRQLVGAQKGMDNECKKESPKLTIFEARINNIQQEIYALEDKKPKLKIYTINKLTVEKLLLIIEENPDGILCVMDEGSSHLIKLSKDEHCSERELYLSGYNGDTPYTYRTVSRGEVVIPRVVLSLLIGIQPNKLRRFINEAKNGSQDDGFLQRFQGIVYPDKKHRLPKDKRGEEALFLELDNIFKSLDSMPSGEPALLHFDDDGQNIFDEWREKTTIDAYDLEPHLSAHVGKSYEFVAALSVYLCLYENNGQLPENNKIAAIFVLRAIILGTYFLSSAKRMYGLAYQDEMPARSLAEKLARLEGSDFTRSQIRNRDWSNLKTAEERQEAIKTLINRGYISEQTQGKYYINPKYLEE